MPHIPFHNFIGPGTDLKEASNPVDVDDQIAHFHDYLYEKGVDVSEADEHAIADFWSDFAANQNFHSLIGGVGLSIKQVVEKVIGQQYPMKRGGDPILAPAKFKASEQSNSAPPVQVSQPSSSSNDISMAEPQAGGSLPGGTGSSQMPLSMGCPRSSKSTVTFRKAFQIYTAGLQFAHAAPTIIEDYTEHPNIQSGTLLTVTPLAVIDPNWLPLFMTYAEFFSLPTWAWATKCRIKVTPLGYRLPFATNEANSSFANSQTLVQIAHGVGINTEINCLVGGYTLNASDSTKIEGITLDMLDLSDTLYGTTDGAPPTIGANVGVPRYWNRYLTLMQPPNIPGNYGSPNLRQLIEIQNVNDVKGTPVITYEHTFNNGMLYWNKESGWYAQSGCVGDNVVIDQGLRFSGATRRLYKRSGAGLQTQNDLQYMNSVIGNPNSSVNYVDFIEKGPWLARQTTQTFSADHAPLLSFGCLPVQSNVVQTGAPTFANACVQWNIETELEVESTYSYIANNLVPWLSSFEENVFCSNFNSALNGCDRAYYVLQGKRVGSVGSSLYTTQEANVKTVVPPLKKIKYGEKDDDDDEETKIVLTKPVRK